MKRLASWVVLSAVAVAFMGVAQAGPIFSLTSPTPFSNGSWSFGEIFTVGAQNITVTALGAFDAGDDGFDTAGGIPVGVFRESDTALLASTTVTSTDTLLDHFRYASIAPLVLLSGVQYRVVAVSGDDLYNVSSSFLVDPAVTRDGGGYCAGTTLASCNDLPGGNLVFMANLEFGSGGGAVPEPVSFVLSGAGLLALVAIRRRRRPENLPCGR